MPNSDQMLRLLVSIQTVGDFLDFAGRLPPDANSPFAFAVQQHAQRILEGDDPNGEAALSWLASIARIRELKGQTIDLREYEAGELSPVNDDTVLQICPACGLVGEVIPEIGRTYHIVSPNDLAYGVELACHFRRTPPAASPANLDS